MRTAGFVSPLLLVLLAIGLGGACATTTTTSSTWSQASGPLRTGQVESVQEVVHHFQGNPAGGALAGALIGGFLFGGRGPAALVGAMGGAAVGASASQGAWERRSYHIFVRFAEGDYGVFVYDGYPPFRPGEYVVLTPQGLTRR